MSRVKLANQIVKACPERFAGKRGLLIDMLAMIEKIAVGEMIANMDGESDSLHLMAARARKQAQKKLAGIAPESLTKDWKK